MPDAQPERTAVLVHLTGAHRGSRQPLGGGSVLIGTSEGATVHYPADTPGVAPRHATLIREGDRWVLWAEPREAVFVEGERIDEHPLQPGEVIQIGHGGPFLRFRIQDRPPGEYKTMTQALQDCVDCTRYGEGGRVRRVGSLLAALPRDLLTQTAPGVRVIVLAFLFVLAGGLAALGAYAVRLEQRLDEEARRLETIESAVRRSVVDGDRGDLAEALAEIRSGLTERIEALESRTEAGRRVVAEAAASVMLLQGAYRFRDTAAGELLRVVVGPEGRPLPSPTGGPLTRLGGSGPPLERYFTGSAFLASAEGRANAGGALLVTNRHVVRPWEFDEAARAYLTQGYVPELRLVGFLPDISTPFDIEVAGVSEEADVALARARALDGPARTLPLGSEVPRPGDEVIVLGYPTGFAALFARSEASVVDSLLEAAHADFWQVGREISEAGLVRPLATRGIVGQVTDASIVYDAETTRGGSGGPVLDLEGRVVAVTVGVMESFGGSNLGVPIEHVRGLLEGSGTSDRRSD